MTGQDSVRAVTHGLSMELLQPAPLLISPDQRLCVSPLPSGASFPHLQSKGTPMISFRLEIFLSDFQKPILLELMDMFMMWIVVMVSWVYIYVKTYQRAYFKYRQFIVCHVYLNTAI